MKLSETYRGVDFVVEGEIVDSHGKPLRLQTLIKRRWGWGGRASNDAAEALRGLAGDRPVRLWLAQERRRAQQAELFSIDAGLVNALCDGLARGSQREAGADQVLEMLVVRFSEPITDHGVVAGVLEAVAFRLDVPVVDLLERLATVNLDETMMDISIDVPEDDDV